MRRSCAFHRAGDGVSLGYACPYQHHQYGVEDRGDHCIREEGWSHPFGTDGGCDAGVCSGECVSRITGQSLLIVVAQFGDGQAIVVTQTKSSMKSGAEKMNVSENGTNVSAKVVELSRDFMLVDYCGRIYRIDFDRYPYFRCCFLSELYNVQASAAGLHWPDADIDLEVEYIENPPSETSEVDLDWWKAQRKRKNRETPKQRMSR